MLKDGILVAVHDMQHSTLTITLAQQTVREAPLINQLVTSIPRTYMIAATLLPL